MTRSRRPGSSSASPCGGSQTRTRWSAPPSTSPATRRSLPREPSWPLMAAWSECVMGWDFAPAPEFQAKLDWADRFVTDECEPLDLAFPDQERMPPHPALRAVVLPLSGQVREQGLWAAHLRPDRGGGGYGQLSLALLNEVLGRSQWAPVIFGTQAPDSGNAEILARYGTPEQQAAYLEPLLSGEIFSCYSMTE